MCLRPITVRNPNYIPNSVGSCFSYTVPCGKCEECLKDRQNSFLIRSYFELSSAPSCLLTFTYNQKNIPYCVDSETGVVRQTLRREDVHGLLDALRHWCMRKSIPFPRYYICGEYGEKSFRPHYHGLFVTQDSYLLDYIKTYWSTKYGFVDIKRIEPSAKSFQNSARYVAKYTAKSVLTRHSDVRFIHPMVAPFCVHSRKWGDSFLSKLAPMLTYCLRSDGTIDYDLLVFQSKVSIGNVSYKLPRYYKERLFPKILSPEVFSDSWSHASYSKALERHSNIHALQSKLGCSFGEASKIVDSSEGYILDSRKSDDIDSTERQLKRKRLDSYAKDIF